ncbi:MAG: GntR family transcriptional regulator [Clostridia bacterium]|nr:GntR family transcriptional regulator [Clostridia bacterium]
MMEHKTVSLADQVFERLETDILSGKYQKGEVLTEAKLTQELGVSRTPVREALRRLQAEHIIEESAKGMVVMGISKQDLKDIFDIRARLEGIAAKMAAENITEEQLKELKEVVDLQEFWVNKGDPDHIKGLDSRFHELVYRFSGSMIYCDTLIPLHKKTQKYRRVSVENKSRASRSMIEHRAVYDAIAARDGAMAEQLLVEHIRNAADHILKSDI